MAPAARPRRSMRDARTAALDAVRRVPVALAVVLLAVALLASASSAAARGGTSIHLYMPFDGGAIASGVRVDRRAKGSCWTTSLSDARGDAFRCLVGNDIYDPCFARPPDGTATFVLCPLFTPGAAVLRLNLTKKLPPGSRSDDPTRYPPWAVQTEAGAWCTLVTGATGTIEGLQISYGCAGGASLLGDLKRSAGGWTVFFAANSRETRTPLVALRSAWW